MADKFASGSLCILIDALPLGLARKEDDCKRGERRRAARWVLESKATVLCAVMIRAECTRCSDFDFELGRAMRSRVSETGIVHCSDP